MNIGIPLFAAPSTVKDPPTTHIHQSSTKDKGEQKPSAIAELFRSVTRYKSNFIMPNEITRNIISNSHVRTAGRLPNASRYELNWY